MQLAGASFTCFVTDVLAIRPHNTVPSLTWFPSVLLHHSLVAHPGRVVDGQVPSRTVAMSEMTFPTPKFFEEDEWSILASVRTLDVDDGHFVSFHRLADTLFREPAELWSRRWASFRRWASSLILSRVAWQATHSDTMSSAVTSSSGYFQRPSYGFLWRCPRAQPCWQWTS